MPFVAIVRRFRFLPVLAISILPLGIAGPAVGEPLQFNRDIRPILSDKCFICHGLTKKEGIELRLDKARSCRETGRDSARQAR